jgi:hypothetical protein
MTGHQAFGRPTRRITDERVRWRDSLTSFAANDDAAVRNSAPNHEIEIAYRSREKAAMHRLVSREADRFEWRPQIQRLAIPGQPHAGTRKQDQRAINPGKRRKGAVLQDVGHADPPGKRRESRTRRMCRDFRRLAATILPWHSAVIGRRKNAVGSHVPALSDAHAIVEP